MIAALCYLVFGVVVAGSLLLACLAITDCMARGDRKIAEAVRQMEAARDVTGRVPR